MDCNLPGSSVHGVLQATMLEWRRVATPFSRGSSWPRDRTWVSYIGRHILYHLSHQRSSARDQTCSPCIGRWGLNHWTSRDVPAQMFLGAYYVPGTVWGARCTTVCSWGDCRLLAIDDTHKSAWSRGADTQSVSLATVLSVLTTVPGIKQAWWILFSDSRR